MSDYTPSLEELSDYYIEGRLQMHDGFQPANEEQFDRVIAKIKADAWEEGQQAGFYNGHNHAKLGFVEYTNPYKEETK